MKISASRVNVFATCPRQYYYKYVEKAPTDTDFVEPDYFSFGNVLHRILELCVELPNFDFEQIYKVVSDEPPKPQKTASEWEVSNYEQILKRCEFIKNQKDECFKGKMFLMYTVFKKLLRNNPQIKILATEKRIETQHAVIVIDAIMVIDDKWYIIDYKTTSGSLENTKDLSPMHKNSQVSLYAAHKEIIEMMMLKEKIKYEFGGVGFIHFNKLSTNKMTKKDTDYLSYANRLMEDNEDGKFIRVALVDKENIDVQEALANFQVQKDKILELHNPHGKDFGAMNRQACVPFNLSPCPYFSKCHGNLLSQPEFVKVFKGTDKIDFKQIDDPFSF